MSAASTWTCSSAPRAKPNAARGGPRVQYHAPALVEPCGPPCAAPTRLARATPRSAQARRPVRRPHAPCSPAMHLRKPSAHAQGQSQRTRVATCGTTALYDLNSDTFGYPHLSHSNTEPNAPNARVEHQHSRAPSPLSETLPYERQSPRTARHTLLIPDHTTANQPYF